MASVEGGGFPFPTFFDRDAFIGDVERAWLAPDRGDEDEIGRLLREKGLRFVIEAAADVGLDIKGPRGRGRYI